MALRGICADSVTLLQNDSRCVSLGVSSAMAKASPPPATVDDTTHDTEDAQASGVTSPQGAKDSTRSPQQPTPKERRRSRSDAKKEEKQHKASIRKQEKQLRKSQKLDQRRSQEVSHLLEQFQKISATKLPRSGSVNGKIRRVRAIRCDGSFHFDVDTSMLSGKQPSAVVVTHVNADALFAPVGKRLLPGDFVLKVNGVNTTASTTLDCNY